MKKKLIITTLLGLLCTVTHADNTQSATAANIAANELPTPTAKVPEETSSLPSAPQPLPVLDCQYPIPATTKTVDQTIVSTWAQKAAIQSFDFNATEIDAQLEELKPCFTVQGWQGFKNALDKSGNITAIKSQNLTVSSQVEGEVKINPVKENEWKVTLPMQVVYQNDKEKLTQLLSVNLLVGRKISGNLGILQVIATPKDAAAAMPTVTPEKTNSD